MINTKTGITHKPTILNQADTKKTELKKIDDNKDLVTITGENAPEQTIDPKAILSSLKEGKLDSLKDFVSKNSTWGAFIAGIAAGLAENTIEKKDEMANYLKDLKANVVKHTKKVKNRARLQKLANALGLTFMGGLIPTALITLGAFSGEGGATLAKSSLLLADVGIGLVAGGLQTYLEFSKDSKGINFIPISENDFMTVPPDSNNIFLCKKKIHDVTGEIYPTIDKIIELPSKPVSIKGAEIKYKEPNLVSKLTFTYPREGGRSFILKTRDTNENLWENIEEEIKTKK